MRLSPEQGAPRPAADTPRVAYIMSRFPKLTETFVLYEILAVEALGTPVEVYPLLRERQPVAHPDAEAWLRRARFQPFLSLDILRANGHFLRRDPARYLRMVRDVLRHTWGSANFFIGALGILPKTVRFAREMEQRGITHVHAHFATHPALAALIVHRLTGIPYSFTAHGSDLHVDRRMLDVKVAESAFAVTVSAFNKEVMVGACGERLRDRIHVVRCGVDATVFHPVQRRDETPPLRIVCVASFEEVKGHRYLIEACRLLRDRGIAFHCDLVGAGPLRRDVLRRIAEARLQHCVVLRGGMPRPDVARLVAEAHVAVLASSPTREGKREGIPVALMEAMACGLPVVATAISGIPELVESGQTGFLVPPQRPDLLADRLVELAQDPSLRTRLGATGRHKVLAEYDIRHNARRLLDLFVGLAPPTPARRPIHRTPTGARHGRRTLR